jgi:hypothetical protein
LDKGENMYKRHPPLIEGNKRNQTDTNKIKDRLKRERERFRERASYG